MSTRILVIFFVAVMLITVSGCSSTRKNLVYDVSRGNVKEIPNSVMATLIPPVDIREGMMTYPKQIIVQKSYRGDTTYEINDRTVEDVFAEALAQELKRSGVDVVATPGIAGPLDRDTAENVRKILASRSPEMKLAFGAKITDFLAESQRSVVTTKVKVKASLQLYILDVKTGELLWSDSRSDWSDTVASADRNYMVEQLNQALSSLIHKTVRDNVSLRELLIKISNR
jgi:PBP1b-binding outer membrane lipoprotein LpoB